MNADERRKKMRNNPTVTKNQSVKFIPEGPLSLATCVNSRIYRRSSAFIGGSRF
jgi:hypothetical protein